MSLRRAGTSKPEKPWDDMTPDERGDEMDRVAAELLRRLHEIVQELEGVASDAETLRRDIAEIRDLLGEQRRRAEAINHAGLQ